MFVIDTDKQLDNDTLQNFINQFISVNVPANEKNKNAYIGNYEIFTLPKKAEWKPDNRIAVNFARYIVDTLNGFFLGIPIKITSDDEKTAEYIEFHRQYNNQDNKNFEISKMCSIYGYAYEVCFVDDKGYICSVADSPLQGFMIYDNSIMQKKRYYVRLFKDAEGKQRGTLFNEVSFKNFIIESKIEFEQEKPHGFDGVPVIEFFENEERLGLIGNVINLINQYNKVLSEKANDVDYFADAYLKILGARLEQEDLEALRSNRIINFTGQLEGGLEVDFLSKPNADTTQENMLAHLEKQIFKTSMVADINDENFGSSSGIALKYKLQSMSNLAKFKEQKFIASLNERYKLIFSNPINSMNEDDWIKVKYQFTQNYPANILEEVQTAAQATGILSKESQLKLLSVVDNVNEELDRLNSDNDVTRVNVPYSQTRVIDE